ncbi:DUF2076 domain-containing protein [Sphingomonas nostoxanthinifaciens]|uniref:DUF2076 domain-containing protein n=1 Tax=Sphingomonas nostoxanthinifaciens TaxID=2872652 RepID=UPI001CC1EF1E|nr:DUF2076 domain-containing protein [Sphingomonas nostoxanthinifaciens]UAK26330.1 DUF2076 domain-containing protein [Sphingomonas nostoxanthinifaciens]
MTPDERALLSRFFDDLNTVRGVQKDSEADALIHQALSANPDAAYVLVQHAIVADQSLHAAQARIADLENQLRNAQPAPAASSFLPQSGAWGQRPAAAPAYAPAPQDYEPMPPQQRPGMFSANSGLGSFLRSAGTTAAGVAGGEMLFSGLSDMFGGHRGGGMFGGGQNDDRPEEVVVNNYYDDDGGSNDGGSDDQSNW